MSRNLIIYKIGRTSQQVEPLGDLDMVTAALNGAFIDLEWESPIKAALPVDLDGGFRVKLTMQGGKVQDVYTDAGVNHIRQFAGLCNRQGWRMADAREGEDFDVNDPQKLYVEERSARGTSHRAPGRAAAPLHRQGRATALRVGRLSKWVMLFVLAAGLVALGFYLWRRFGGQGR
jgi:hypothetical protein